MILQRLRDCRSSTTVPEVVMAISRTRYRVLTPPGLRVKQLVLGIGAVYFTFVAVTNIVNFIVSVGGYRWTFLNSGNVSYITSCGSAPITEASSASISA
jgi:hypothetical protein